MMPFVLQVVVAIGCLVGLIQVEFLKVQRSASVLVYQSSTRRRSEGTEVSGLPYLPITSPREGVDCESKW